MNDEVISFGIFEKRALLYAKVFGRYRLTAPRALLGQDDNPQLLDGVLTAILILFLPWAFKGTA